ncbi:MAG: heavy-metal-associated domain-containing protein [Castellaniella sp.]|uniref:heavy-metal-associated domain-containing protein n=1 Tax=Castellaniella sp. TaxID=1955812 RepID=UPI0011F7B143|nr:heavy metal-associated domain-containing protein [Castellaniella sp.]TAN30386.1 MAG: heavy-metal-associated domain-containing protein [Castellaniella sp.]
MNQQESRQSHETTILSVSGMTCGGCANTVTRILSRIPGVAKATVDIKTGQATVRGTATSADLVAAVEAAGYGARDLEADVEEGVQDGHH